MLGTIFQGMATQQAALPSNEVSGLVATPLFPLWLTTTEQGVVGLAPWEPQMGEGAPVGCPKAIRLHRKATGWLNTYFRLFGSECVPSADTLERLRTSAEELMDWSAWTPFAKEVARHLLSGTPAGETTTYGQLAAMVGRPKAARAVGRVMASNPVPLLVPCHRVVSADGLRGFAWGLPAKRFLLDWERSAQAAPAV